jgi:hypothetical protein
MKILPDYQSATRNNSYKIVQLTEQNCADPTAKDTVVTEFYKINEHFPIPLIDKEGDDLCGGMNCEEVLTGDDLKNYHELLQAHNKTLSSEPSCPGDGNEDLKVNQKDIDDWSYFASFSNGGSSWYDLNLDGKTDSADLLIIKKNLGRDCRHSDEQ